MKEAKLTLLQFAKMTVAERKALPLPEYGELIADWMEMGELLRSNPNRVALVEPSDRTPGALRRLGHGAKSIAGTDAVPASTGAPTILIILGRLALLSPPPSSMVSSQGALQERQRASCKSRQAEVFEVTSAIGSSSRT
jgi:hypothetical protein